MAGSGYSQRAEVDHATSLWTLEGQQGWSQYSVSKDRMWRKRPLRHAEALITHQDYNMYESFLFLNNVTLVSANLYCMPLVATQNNENRAGLGNKCKCRAAAETARSECSMWAAPMTMNNRWVENKAELRRSNWRNRHIFTNMYLQTTEGHMEEKTDWITQPVSEAATGLNLMARQIWLGVFCFLDLDKKSKNTFIEMYTIKSVTYVSCALKGIFT